MRVGLVLVCLLLVGCVGPHSTGALWAQQNVDQELAMGRLSDAQRLDRARAYELMLADEALAAERARIVGSLQDCPGAVQQPLDLSAGDRVRDAIRVRAADDPARLAGVARVALADWRLRRARATGQAEFCVAAQQALDGLAPTQDAAGEGDVLAGLGSATVARDPQHPGLVEDSAAFARTLSQYALGSADTVRAPAPLPQYLAALYGGVLIYSEASPGLTEPAPEAMIDRLAPAYPQWEPDALYVALRGA